MKMTEKEWSTLEVKLENRITEKRKLVSESTNTGERQWAQDDLNDYLKIRKGIRTDTLGKVLMLDQYGEVWEKWMVLTGNAQDI